MHVTGSDKSESFVGAEDSRGKVLVEAVASELIALCDSYTRTLSKDRLHSQVERGLSRIVRKRDQLIAKQALVIAGLQKAAAGREKEVRKKLEAERDRVRSIVLKAIKTSGAGSGPLVRLLADKLGIKTEVLEHESS